MLSPEISTILPPEILLQIFHHATEGRLVIEHRTRCIQLDTIHVCTLWREAALGDASLWTTIVLWISMNDALDGGTIVSHRYISSLFALAIHNARGSLLDLSMFLRHSLEDNSTETAEGVTRDQNDPILSPEVELASQIVATSPRWRAIKLQVSTPKGIRFATSLMQARGNLQELREADILAVGKSEFDFAPMIAAPSLQKLRCHWIDQLVLPSRLTSISIQVRLESSVWIQTLLLCKSLRYIAIMGGGDWNDAGSSNNAGIVPTTLQHVIELRTDHPPCLVKWLTLPSLAKLHIKLCPEHHTCLDLFFQRSACRLHTFSTVAAPVLHDIRLLPTLCPILNAVEYLAIDSSDIGHDTNPFLTLLSILRDVQSLPLLHTINIMHLSVGPPQSFFGVRSAVIGLRDAIQVRREAGRLQRVIVWLKCLEDVIYEPRANGNVGARYFNALEDLQSWNASYDPAVDISVHVLGSRVAHLIVLNDEHGSKREHHIQWEMS
ncbi:hypothetical protein CYLTODRAFT_494673 [Cylindrobasidium torrendii FP15055 ss-10]|uniref:F-box domain-containing protein n=1 Tax=Cylindrobasidium torrendii FP15055 ss-10 TaxID=1314674 RepID=A0A0D7AYP9_9AGAR|nr:hypothetical protein CYLTODRAFT_494673 [Cylindrobasidium torrendii FP15055 ss-10]